MRRLTRGGTAKPSRETKFSGANADGDFLCSADHEQDWQPYPVDPYTAICVTIHTCILSRSVFEVISTYLILSRKVAELALRSGNVNNSPRRPPPNGIIIINNNNQQLILQAHPIKNPK